jgi:hypothetical protein
MSNEDAVPSLTDEQKSAAITACALMIKGICLTTPDAEWTERIENRIRYLLRQITPTQQADAAIAAGGAREQGPVAWVPDYILQEIAQGRNISSVRLSRERSVDCDAPLYAAPLPRVAATAPNGWRIRLFDDGAAVVEKVGLGGVVCKSSDESIASAILRELAGDLLAASPAAPAQSGGVAPLSVMRAAFRVTEAEGNPDPKKQRFHMRFIFRSMDELHAADDQWRIFSNAAPQPSQPVEAGEAPAPLMQWQEGAGLLWDVFDRHGKWFKRIVSPIGWDAHAVYLAMMEARYAPHIDIRLVSSTTNASPDEPSAVVLDDERAAWVDARYVVIGYGETDHPQAAFANEREQLLDAVLGMMYTKASDADAEIREAYAKDLADDDEWSHEGIWRTEFEIGGIVIYDLGPRAASPQATARLTDEAILAALRPQLTEADGGYVCDLAQERVIAAGRDLLKAAQLNVGCPDGAKIAAGLGKQIEKPTAKSTPTTAMERTSFETYFHNKGVDPDLGGLEAFREKNAAWDAWEARARLAARPASGGDL